jgi:hypothetical protein
LIAKDKTVKELSVLCNSETSRSSIYVDIDRGLHTGFQDDLVIFNVNLSEVLGMIGLFKNVLVNIFSFFRTRTGQLEITRTLLSYFCSQMVKGESITIEEAMHALKTDPDMNEKWVEKATVTYGTYQ